ncbi:MAG: 4Fe-4S binding protein [Deltaproteobacteria bacterium]|jgi:NADH-quinone oxidoreductase subunit I|nr:4Fe-4S binding protein [Deltaproteobacteria bacterium]
MLKAIWDNIKGLYSLLVGMSITGRYLLSPVETIHYPRQVVDDEILASFRGPIRLTFGKKDPAQTRCISCQMCVKACPGHCLTVTKGDAKAPVVWLYDFSYCCLCGACVETCPAGALEFSHNVYLVTTTREELVFNLLGDLKKRATTAAKALEAESASPAAKPVDASKAAEAPNAAATPAAEAKPAAEANPTEAVKPAGEAAKPGEATSASKAKGGEK